MNEPSANAAAACDLFIANATTADGERVSIAVADGVITAFGDAATASRPASVGRELDASEMIVAPARCNAHTHASMTLFRGFADDLALMDWLQDHIWPAEARLVEDDCYWGARLACLEMIRTGTTMFNDMYWHLPGVARAVRDSQLRAVVAAPVIMFVDLPFEAMAREALAAHEAGDFGERVQIWLGPHGPHTVTREQLEWIAAFATEHGLGVHTHVAETLDEMKQIRERYVTTPIRLLNDIGLLREKFVAAHCVWADDEELDIIAKAGASVAHCPSSNMKLASGGAEGRAFSYTAAKAKGINVAIGTDGVCSNNNLDMFEETKIAALLAKQRSGEPTAMPAHEALEAASASGFRALGVNAGRLEVGARADLVLLRRGQLALTPEHNLASHLAYAINGYAVDTTICDGQVLMQAGAFDQTLVGDVGEIAAKAAAAAARVCGT